MNTWLPCRLLRPFLEKGVLTPAEFVRAGDELVFQCPAWSWESGTTTKSYLPADKQYLVTRNVPCPTRVSEMEEMVVSEQQDDGDWMVSTMKKKSAGSSHLEDEFAILDQDGEVVVPTRPVGNAEETAAAEDDDEYADMADYYEDDNVLPDDDQAAASPNDDEDNPTTVHTRTYDLSITYDKYYQTPRVWMVGRSDRGQPLTGTEMLQDVMQDYANKTVTIEAHPHVAGPHASIHPCKHGKVMKTIVHNLIAASAAAASEDTQPTVEMYLFIFLKFVSSIIPTIAYDFTMDVKVDTRK